MGIFFFNVLDIIVLKSYSLTPRGEKFFEDMLCSWLVSHINTGTWSVFRMRRRNTRREFFNIVVCLYVNIINIMKKQIWQPRILMNIEFWIFTDLTCTGWVKLVIPELYNCERWRIINRFFFWRNHNEINCFLLSSFVLKPNAKIEIWAISILFILSFFVYVTMLKKYIKETFYSNLVVYSDSDSRFSNHHWVSVIHHFKGFGTQQKYFYLAVIVLWKNPTHCISPFTFNELFVPKRTLNRTF